MDYYLCIGQHKRDQSLWIAKHIDQDTRIKNGLLFVHRLAQEELKFMNCKAQIRIQGSKMDYYLCIDQHKSDQSLWIAKHRLGYRDQKWIIICASTGTRGIRVYELQSIDQNTGNKRDYHLCIDYNLYTIYNFNLELRRH